MKIYADYHTHTKYSHGKNTVLENAQAAKEKGLKEIAITDHGYGHFLFGMKRRDFNNLKTDVENASKLTGVRVLVGVEANITNKNGDIDLTPEEQKKFDIILCGIHRAVKKGKGKRIHFLFAKNKIKQNTAIVVSALKKNKIDVLTHPGRYLPVDLVEVANACKETNTLFELNASSCCFTQQQFEALAKTGAKFVVGSDAHTKERVGDVYSLVSKIENIFAKEQIVNAQESFSWKR